MDGDIPTETDIHEDDIWIEIDEDSFDDEETNQITSLDITTEEPVWEVEDTRPDCPTLDEDEWTEVVNVFTCPNPFLVSDHTPLKSSSVEDLVAIAEMINKELPLPIDPTEPTCPVQPEGKSWIISRAMLIAIGGIGLLVGLAIPLL